MEPKRPSANCSGAAFDLIEALENEPHLGMTESPEIWKAYAKLVRRLGGKPMRKWWKQRTGKPQPAAKKG